MHWRKSAEQNEREKKSFHYLVVLVFTALIASFDCLAGSAFSRVTTFASSRQTRPWTRPAFRNIQLRFICARCRKCGAEVRPDFNWNRPTGAAMMGYRNTVASA
ncbi:hypothetical protein ACRQ5Q_09290 [Bradyrhizobium sp. PMVTL-01]|uniref:hypothetical protein n=1 Tax=Bradyrhizobium sp. PMVTL-01 TaxID=3434999 RepID=UPI003F6E5724